MARDWIANLDDRAADHGVDLRGAYVTPNEHRFYIVVEADAFEEVTRFLGPPFAQDHDGRVAPVLELKEGMPTVFEE